MSSPKKVASSSAETPTKAASKPRAPRAPKAAPANTAAPAAAVSTNTPQPSAPPEPSAPAQPPQSVETAADGVEILGVVENTSGRHYVQLANGAVLPGWDIGAPPASPLGFLRASPWLLLAVACLVPLFWIVGANFAELLLWPLAKIALILWIAYWADRSLHRDARLHWYSRALLPIAAGEEIEVTHLRQTVPIQSLIWLAIGAWLRRGTILVALIAVFAKAY